MVEFVLHLIEEYYPSYDKARKSVFADVHFLLFYTAIVNALFSIVTAMIVTRISKQLWIQTELLEMYHYNDIQQTFQQIQKELNALHSTQGKAVKKSEEEDDTPPPPVSTSDPEVGTRADENDASATIWEDPWTYGQMNVRNFYTSMIDHIRYPNLKYQYDTLLAQIRFHDLRSHIISSYQLPKQLKISNYLMRCSEQTVLMKLVHVSSLAWLLLTGCVCIFYFVLGIVFYKYEDQTLIGTSLSIIYVGWMLSFVILCFVLSNKTKSIFYTLLHDTELWNVATNSIQEKERLAQKQLALFWYSEPALIIKLIQFMQFGYAASLSTVIVFWTEIDDGIIPMYGYVVTLVFCYLLFTHVTGHAIPRYTLCTSLGQLVNDRYLRETVALYRLNEAKQKEKERYYDDIHDHFPRKSTVNAKDNQLNSSIIVVNQDNYLQNLNSEPESLSDHALKPVNETMCNEQFETEDQRPTLDNEQVNRWLNGADTAVSLKAAEHNDSLAGSTATATRETKKYNMTGSSSTKGENMKLVERLESIPSNDDEDNKIEERRVFELDDDKNESRFSKLDDSSNHASITFENLVLNKVVTANNDKNSDDDDETVNDDLYVSYAENLQPSTKSPGSAIIKQSSFRDSRRTMMMNQRHRQSSKFENLSFIHRLCNYLHSYYTSERHIEVSNVYGAIVAFFLVGQRVEGFIHSQEIVSSAFLSFHYRLDVTFWLLSAWLFMFIGASVLIAVLLWCYDDYQTMKGYKLGAAALIDFVISSVCLIVLFVAEANRCCESEANPASAEQLNRSDFNDPGPIPCSCPQFGTRKYGGLGTIEPYVSLVFLRIFRHWVARKMMKAINRKYKWPNVKLSHEEEEHGKHQLAKSTHQITKFGGHTMNHLNNMSIVTEMWEATIGANPDVAAKYGEFSTEILRAMLGLPSPGDEPSTSSKNSAGNKPSDPTASASNNPSTGIQLFALQQQYSSLSPEAQEIILSGKIGRRMIRSTSCKLEKSPPPVSRNSLTRNQSVMFEIDNYDSSDDDDETNYSFISPNARLIHSMRRCDRKFLPLLDKWTTVDVLITRFEIVYLEVAVDDTYRESSASADCIREALQATKGGKGLRLCDVVAGRQVTGRVGLADIQCLHVERYLPYEEDDIDVDAALCNDGPNVEVESIEYWRMVKSRPSLQNSYNKPTRTQEWCHFKEDHLRIETASGTLILRFFADLEDAKHHPEHLSVKFEETGELFQNNALQWAKSVANFCGPEQLTKQDMSHFGENSSEELRDYLVIVDRKRKRHSHLRLLSDGVDNMLSTRLSFRGVARPNLIQRVMSVRALSANSTGTVERNIRQHFDAFDTSSGDPGSGVLPSVIENKNDRPTSNGRKVSFSQMEK